ncbi:MAG: CAAX prenyl protease-related protein [Burkholderiales bacterium]
MHYTPAYCRILPFALYMLVLAGESGISFLADQGWIAVFDMRWLYLLRILAAGVGLAYCWRHYRELDGIGKLNLRDWVMAVGCGLIVFVLWINLDQPWASMGASTGFKPIDASGLLDVPLVVLRIAGAVLIVPIIEELFWRSFIMRWIKHKDFLSVSPRVVGMGAYVISAALFASEHTLLLAGLLAGLVYGALYMYTSRLWVPVIAHAVTNGVLGFWILNTGHWEFW